MKNTLFICEGKSEKKYLLFIKNNNSEYIKKFKNGLNNKKEWHIKWIKEFFDQPISFFNDYFNWEESKKEQKINLFFEKIKELKIKRLYFFIDGDVKKIPENLHYFFDDLKNKIINQQKKDLFWNIGIKPNKKATMIFDLLKNIPNIEYFFAMHFNDFIKIKDKYKIDQKIIELSPKDKDFKKAKKIWEIFLVKKLLSLEKIQKNKCLRELNLNNNSNEFIETILAFIANKNIENSIKAKLSSIFKKIISGEIKNLVKKGAKIQNTYQEKNNFGIWKIIEDKKGGQNE